MKTNLLTQVILAGLMTTVMTACQKGSDSNATPASATPAPTEATIEKPKSALEIKDEAEAQLATIGLKFVEQTEAEDPLD